MDLGLKPSLCRIAACILMMLISDPARGQVSSDRSKVQPIVNFEFRNTKLSSIVEKISDLTGTRHQIVGQSDLPVTGRCTGSSAATAFRELDAIAGTLSVIRGKSVTVYSSGAAEVLKDESIIYLFRFRFASVKEVLNETFETQSNYRLSQTDLGTELSDVQIVPELNGVLIRGKFADVKGAVSMLQLVDRPQQNVMIELLIVEYALGKSCERKFDLRDGSVKKPGAETLTDLQATNVLSPMGVTDLEYTGIGARLTTKFKANLTSLVVNDQARIVTNPRVMTLSGHEGKFDFKEVANMFTVSIPTAGELTTTSPISKQSTCHSRILRGKTYTPR